MEDMEDERASGSIQIEGTWRRTVVNATTCWPGQFKKEELGAPNWLQRNPEQILFR